ARILREEAEFASGLDRPILPRDHKCRALVDRHNGWPDTNLHAHRSPHFPVRRGTSDHTSAKSVPRAESRLVSTRGADDLPHNDAESLWHDACIRSIGMVAR